MHQSFEIPAPLPWAWWGHSLSVSVKASEELPDTGAKILSEVGLK